MNNTEYLAAAVQKLMSQMPEAEMDYFVAELLAYSLLRREVSMIGMVVKHRRSGAKLAYMFGSGSAVVPRLEKLIENFQVEEGEQKTMIDLRDSK